jgi:DNA-binding CsgD family transcriptional regulator
MGPSRQQDLNRLSESLHDLYSPVSAAEFPERLFRLLRRFIACDFCSYHEQAGLQTQRMATSPAYMDEIKLEIFDRYLHQHPSLRAVRATGTQAAVKISDFLTLTEWRRTDLYDAIFRPEQQDYELAYIDLRELPNLAIALSRSRRDFSEKERAMLNLLRPHLLQAYRLNKLLTHFGEASEAGDRGYLVVDSKFRIRFATHRALAWLHEYFGGEVLTALPGKLQDLLRTIRVPLAQKPLPLAVPAEFAIQRGPKRLVVHPLAPLRADEQRVFLSESVQSWDPRPLEALGLTRREAEVLLWVAQGKSNAAIASILDIQERTACKHMENILAKLYVENRTAAAQRALEVLR